MAHDVIFRAIRRASGCARAAQLPFLAVAPPLHGGRAGGFL
ncbi:Hypothetical protein CAP_1762 [Chondromyces apiculatus DSM 436]|uniref:Uncharacterized protein n=1 Tax=Chondromyces apiculatus DSM 436 TaxID=1192034 RepID=A0A017TCK4_9BACT|nr:Hypothetical protein CAP_1762 [Chondromyces apiculatus DSM 436]